MSEEKVNDDRVSLVEEKAKKEAEKELAELSGAAANEAAKAASAKTTTAKADSSGGSSGGDKDAKKASDEPSAEDLAKENPKLETETSNTLPDTTISGQTENFTELVRSTVTLDVDAEDSERWKLAVVMVNVGYQLNSKDDKPWELKSFEKDQAYINGTFVTRDNSMYGSIGTFSFKRL